MVARTLGAILAVVSMASYSQTPLSERLTPAVDVNALIQAALEADAAPVTAFDPSPYPGRCQIRSDLDNERYCWDATGARWLGELRTMLFTENGGLDGEVARFGVTNADATEVDLGPSFNDDVWLVDIAVSWDGPIATAKTLQVRSGTTVLGTVAIGANSNRTDAPLNVVLVNDNYLNVFALEAGNSLVDPWINISYRRIAQ